MAGTPKEAVVSHLPLDKPQVFSWKTPTKLIIQRSCIDVRPADVLSWQVLAILPAFLANRFEAGDSIWKPARMWKDGASLGPTPHSVLEVPQKHNDTLTNMGLSAFWLRPKPLSSSTSTLLLLVLMAVSLKPWREGLNLWIGPRYTVLSSIRLPEISDQNPFILVKTTSPSWPIHLPYMLGTTRHILVIILC